MRKILTLSLVVMLALSLAACNGETSTTDEIASTPDVVETTENVELEEKLVIELVAGEQGEYGTPMTFNKGTDGEVTIIAYHIPAGEYTVTNIGTHMDQFNIYSDETHKTEEGWEEPAESFFVKLIDVNASESFTIEDGQYIKVVEPGKWKIEQK